jgi:peptidoglycan/LPS O-acetylase OafA/YrhL
MALSIGAYVPLALALSPWDWTNLGPFSFQRCRPLLYLVYFFAGFSVGSHGCDRGPLRLDGPVAQHWFAWLAAAMICFGLWGALTSLTLPDWNASPLSYQAAAAIAFPFACASGVLAYLGMALRLLRTPRRTLGQLSRHAYGIYLVHYVFVLWLQYVLTGMALSAPAKMIIVFSIAVPLSWAASAGAAAVAKVRKTAQAHARQPATIPQFASEVAAVDLRTSESGH